MIEFSFIVIQDFFMTNSVHGYQQILAFWIIGFLINKIFAHRNFISRIDHNYPVLWMQNDDNNVRILRIGDFAVQTLFVRLLEFDIIELIMISYTFVQAQ